jgi:hypothetical protein
LVFCYSKHIPQYFPYSLCPFSSPNEIALHIIVDVFLFRSKAFCGKIWFSIPLKRVITSEFCVTMKGHKIGCPKPRIIQLVQPSVNISSEEFFQNECIPDSDKSTAVIEECSFRCSCVKPPCSVYFSPSSINSLHNEAKLCELEICDQCNPDLIQENIIVQRKLQ